MELKDIYLMPSFSGESISGKVETGRKSAFACPGHLSRQLAAAVFELFQG
jgi:hypothetical protein